MNIKCIERHAFDGTEIKSTEVVNDLADYRRVRASVGQASEAYLNEYRVVHNGYIETHAYNAEEQIVDYLTGKMSYQELQSWLEA
jgi:hypothetical protein